MADFARAQDLLARSTAPRTPTARARRDPRRAARERRRRRRHPPAVPLRVRHAGEHRRGDVHELRLRDARRRGDHHRRRVPGRHAGAVPDSDASDRPGAAPARVGVGRADRRRRQRLAGRRRDPLPGRDGRGRHRGGRRRRRHAGPAGGRHRGRDARADPARDRRADRVTIPSCERALGYFARGDDDARGRGARTADARGEGGADRRPRRLDHRGGRAARDPVRVAVRRTDGPAQAPAPPRT